jgi:hypothetical protein
MLIRKQVRQLHLNTCHMVALVMFALNSYLFVSALGRDLAVQRDDNMNASFWNTRNS